MAKCRTTLIISDIPYSGKIFDAAWRRAFPSDEILHFHTTPMGSFQFDIPRDLPISQVPILRDMKLKRRQWSMREGKPSIFNADLTPLLAAADHIVCATDFDPQGARNFLDLVGNYDFGIPLSDITWLPFTRLDDPDHIQDLIHEDHRADDPRLRKMAAFGQAKQYFDHLYLLNALPVFGATLRASGADLVDDQHLISKFSLQTLLLLHRQGQTPLKEGDILRLMRYNPMSHHDSRIGTTTSMGEIFQWLCKSGCLSVQGRSSRGTDLWGISRTGERLLSLIHKDCFDPDLTHRLRKWGETWPASRPMIDRYIRTFFGKQKRYQDRIIRQKDAP